MDIDQLYVVYDKLNAAKDNISEHSKEYSDVIKAAKGNGDKEKTLALQIIPKYFVSFPGYHNQALNAIFDLCEDSVKQIRIAAMKAIGAICKECPNYYSNCVKVMAQMLHFSDPNEQTIVNQVFGDLLQRNPVSVIKNIFEVINDGEIPSGIRFKCIQLILTKIKLLGGSLLTTEVEDLMITNVKETLKECFADEFVMILNYLVSTSYVKSFTGQREITDIVMQQIDIDGDFVPYKPDCNLTNRLVSCVKFILPFYSSKVESTKLVLFYCNKVLPHWEEIGEKMEDNLGMKYQTGIAQQLAIMASSCGTLEHPEKQVECIYNILLTYLPQQSQYGNTLPDLNFSIIESLLCAFHALARQCPEFLLDETRLSDFRPRLLYCARSAKGCSKVLELNTSDKVFNADEKRIREMCPLLFKNIDTLIRDFFYQPPIYKCKIALSFTKSEQAAKSSPAEPKKIAPPSPQQSVKRHAPITFDSNGTNGKSEQPKQKRVGIVERQYQPPTGKSYMYSRGGRGGGFRGRGRGGFRGAYRN